jgi:hypothetical protein
LYRVDIWSIVVHRRLGTAKLKQPQAVYDLLELTVPVQLPERQTMVLELAKTQRGTNLLEIIDKAVEIVMQAENFLAKSLLRRKQPLLTQPVSSLPSDAAEPESKLTPDSSEDATHHDMLVPGSKQSIRCQLRKSDIESDETALATVITDRMEPDALQALHTKFGEAWNRALKRSHGFTIWWMTLCIFNQESLSGAVLEAKIFATIEELRNLGYHDIESLRLAMTSACKSLAQLGDEHKGGKVCTDESSGCPQWQATTGTCAIPVHPEPETHIQHHELRPAFRYGADGGV